MLHARLSRAFLRVVSKKPAFRPFGKDQAHIVCGPSMARIRAHLRSVFEKLVPRQKFVQQHSGD